jgi:hypothetical protein
MSGKMSASAHRDALTNQLVWQDLRHLPEYVDMSKLDIESFHKLLWSNEKDHLQFIGRMFGDSCKELAADIHDIAYTYCIVALANTTNVKTYAVQVRHRIALILTWGCYNFFG